MSLIKDLSLGCLLFYYQNEGSHVLRERVKFSQLINLKAFTRDSHETEEEFDVFWEELEFEGVGVA